MTPFLGEIKLFAGNFAPLGWAMCAGQLMSIAENDALFSLLGTTYGGDGVTTFGLPDLRGRVPLHQGTGAGIAPKVMGQRAGSESVTLTANQLPSHEHYMMASTAAADQASPAGHVIGQAPQIRLYIQDAQDSNMAQAAVGIAGGNQPHPNLMPYMAVNYIIALEGIYPTQN